MTEHLDRFKARKAMSEKSTLYYYFSDVFMKKYVSDTEVADWVDNWIFSNGVGSDQRYSSELTSKEYLDLMTDEEKRRLMIEYKKKFKVSEGEETEIPRKVKLVPGTLVLIQNFGKDDEPRKYIWNNCRGEIIRQNPDKTYKVRITDVKDSNVLYSKNWYDGEEKALRQRLNLTPDEFIPLKDIEDAEKSETLLKQKREQKSIRKTTRRLL